jgi:predicted pyridoxine 5'-phosphate oxidase superfamily flavin-nucleotide-binding protein
MNDASPWHEGERRAQALAGSAPGGAGIRTFMPDQHRVFFAQLPFMVAATLDEAGAPTATLLTSRPGFVQSPDATTLTVAATRDDPAGRRLTEGAPVGLLGIELPTRRRNRANGRIAAADPHGFTVQVLQSFGNCPQYIHPREIMVDRRARTDALAFEGLDAQARRQIAAADTFFVATSSGPGADGRGVEHGGVDASHRGGPPGFVRVRGDVLEIPDYRGNRYFNTLGNLLLDPRAALLFVDFSRGEMLQLQGRAEIDWDDTTLPYAERIWRFTVERGWRGNAGVSA